MSDTQQETLERLRDAADSWLSLDDPESNTAGLIETAFLMAAADGQLSAVEFDQLVATIEFVTKKRFAGDQIRRIVRELEESLRTDGWQSRIDTIALALPDPTARRNAYRLAAGVSFIDGEVQDAEGRLFGLLAEGFEIPPDEASKILEEVRDELFGKPEETTTVQP